MTATLSTRITAAATAAAPIGGGDRVVLSGVSKRYGQVNALTDVDLTIEPSTFTVLLGPSGSGKTTLLRGIAGIERFDDGELSIGGQLVSGGRVHRPAETRGLSMVFQDYALWPQMTVRDNVAYAIRRKHLTSRDAARQVQATLERVGLEAKAERYPHELSGGQQQRVALARALVGDPALVLFDEPLSNLDADLRERLRVEISTLIRSSGSTAVYITHDQSEAFALADRVGILSAGRIEQVGTPEEVYRHPASPFVARFTGLAGSFAGTVRDTVNGAVQVEVLGGLLPGTATRELVPGQAVEAMIRPTATRLQESAASGVPDIGVIRGIVLDVAYRGKGYDHVVETPAGILSQVFDENPWARGSRCEVRIDPRGCLLFPAITPTI